MGPGPLGQLAYALVALQFGAQDPGKFVGPATCNATSCHGATRSDRAAAGSGASAARITQDEYTTWFLRDPHRKAFEMLSAQLGTAMGKRLGIDAPRAAECLACHAVPGGGAHADGGAEPGSPQIAEFGVSCEACHGAASGWYGTHFQKGFDRTAAVAKLGLVDLLEPRKLAESCVGCHLGDATRVVDHRLIAAGHPELRFEAGSQLQRLPAHWRDRGAESRAWRQRTALVGQAVALKAQMERVAREAAAAMPNGGAGSGAELDFASFDCASCHHDLANGSWPALRDYRLARGRPTPVGLPLFDGARFVTAGAVAAAAGPELASNLQAAVAKVEEAAHAPRADAGAIRDAATAAAAVCERVVQALAGLSDPQPAVAAALAALARDAELVAAQGIEGARQASGLLLLLRDGASGAVERDLVTPFSRAESFDPAEFARRLTTLAQEK